MYSNKIELCEKPNGIIYADIQFGKREFIDINELLNILNNVDIDSLRYRPADLRDANIRKQVLVKQLEEQWVKEPDLVKQIIHPDCSYIIETLNVNNQLLRNNGVSCVLEDGEYTLLYLSNKTTLNNFISATRGGTGEIAETVLLPVERRERVCSDYVFLCGSDIKGVAFLIKSNSDMLRLVPVLEESLQTGNLLINYEHGRLYFVFVNKIIGMKG